jgi:hypothetical protein
MNPANLSLIVSLVEEAIQVEPQLVAEFQTIFGNANPTPADWEALRAKVLAKSYADYVPSSALPAASAAAASPPVATAAAQTNAPISQASASQPAYLADGSKNPASTE